MKAIVIQGVLQAFAENPRTALALSQRLLNIEELNILEETLPLDTTGNFIYPVTDYQIIDVAEESIQMVMKYALLPERIKTLDIDQKTGIVTENPAKRLDQIKQDVISIFSKKTSEYIYKYFSAEKQMNIYAGILGYSASDKTNMITFIEQAVQTQRDHEADILACVTEGQVLSLKWSGLTQANSQFPLPGFP